jgi:3-hydroxyisobutyrate dehydrogenase-like beta-hydroxyacid dehydrogenase
MIRRVGFVGLGDIGKPMAANLVAAGFDLMVFDVRKDPVDDLVKLGAKPASSLAMVAQHGELISLVVQTDAQVRDVMLRADGIVENAASGTVVAVHSTVMPDLVRSVAEAAAARGIVVIDAPISGGARGAVAKTLSFMMGGDTATLEVCRPVFEAMGSTLFHVGALGMGLTAKIAHNLIVYVNMLAAAEGMRLAERNGLDVEVFQRIVHASGGQSRIVDSWLNARLGKSGPTFNPDIYYKDLSHALQLGHQVGLSLPGAALTQQLIDELRDVEP